MKRTKKKSGASGEGMRDEGGRMKGDGTLFRYDEWGLAKKMGVRPRFVVGWRREFGVEGVDFERMRGAAEAGLYERIGLTETGCRRVALALGYAACWDLDGAELRREGVQTEVRRMVSNTRLLICERVAAKEPGALENVHVRDSAEFRVGEEFVAVREEGVLKKTGGAWARGEW